jgi:hypothetical protein
MGDERLSRLIRNKTACPRRCMQTAWALLRPLTGIAEPTLRGRVQWEVRKWDRHTFSSISTGV